MSERTVGVIGLPMIFGESRSFNNHMNQLTERGYQVETVDLYDGQQFSQPFFMRLVAGKNSKEKINALVARFEVETVTENINNAADKLAENGSTDTYITGFGLGGVFALKSAESRDFSGISAWYPHLVYPETVHHAPPNFDRIQTPLQLFYGAEDDKIEPGTIEKAQSLTGVEVTVFENTGHAFADRFVQSNFPSPLYKKAAAEASWHQALRMME